MIEPSIVVRVDHVTELVQDDIVHGMYGLMDEIGMKKYSSLR
jgi:hypothetical protein